MDAGKSKISTDRHGGTGLLWCVGWLFTIGYLKLSFWRGVLALLVWPYFMGDHFSVQ